MGNLHGFAAPAEAYQAAVKAGVGSAKVLLPDALRKIVGPIIENGEYAPSTPSGSFSQTGLAELLDISNWADAALLAGDFGRNSETAILLEKFLDKSQAPIIMTKDSVEYFNHLPAKLLKRANTTLVITMAQLQRLVKALASPESVRLGMDLMVLVELLHDLTSKHSANIVIKHSDYMLVSANGQVSTTKLTRDVPIWRVKTAATASVWWLQNPKKPYEALTSAVSTMLKGA